MTKPLVFLHTLLAILASCSANHGRGRRYPAYVHDSFNVLKSIESGEYDKIYVHYHGCVWSEFGNGYGCGNDDKNGGNGDDVTWYLGRTQCYRSNVAYSLFGVRSDDVGKNHPDNICSRRRYYINSFFTKNGVEDFSETVGLANGGDAPAVCTFQDNGNNEDDNSNKADEDNNDAKYTQKHGSLIYESAKSYTTYCNTRGKFVLALFGGAYCTDKSDLQLLDSLESLNNELDNVGCRMIYSKNNAGYDTTNEDAEWEQEGDQNGNNGRRIDEQGKNEDEMDGIANLLVYSDACSVVQYPSWCPDPYGAKKRLDVNPSKSNRFWKQFLWLDWLTLALFLLGTVFLSLAFYVYTDRRLRANTTAKRPQRKGLLSGSLKNRQCSSPRERTSNLESTNNIFSSTETSSTKRQSINSSEVYTKKKGLFKGIFTRKKRQQIVAVADEHCSIVERDHYSTS